MNHCSSVATSVISGDKAFAGTDASVFLWLTDENGKTMGGKNGNSEVPKTSRKFKVTKFVNKVATRSIGILKIGFALTSKQVFYSFAASPDMPSWKACQFKHRARVSEFIKFNEHLKDKLGELHKLTVRHFGTGLSPDWLLSRIELTEVDEQDRPVRPLQVFGCDEWLKPKRIYELGHDQIPAKYFVKILSQKKLTDENGLFVELYGNKGSCLTVNNSFSIIFFRNDSEKNTEKARNRLIMAGLFYTRFDSFLKDVLLIILQAIDLGELKAAALFNESGNDWIVERVVVVAPSGEKLVLDFQKSYINPSGLKAFL